jgi:hypothetical protein
LHFVPQNQFRNKMQPHFTVRSPTRRMGQNPRKNNQEDSMTHLALLLSGPDEVFGNFGMWAFLSCGAVALFGIFLPITTWLESRRKEREAFYKAETLRRVSEGSGDAAKASIEFLREQSRIVRFHTLEGLKIGGLIMTGIGIGVVVLLWFVAGPDLAACGLVPLLIGVAMLVYVYYLAAPVE